MLVTTSTPATMINTIQLSNITPYPLDSVVVHVHTKRKDGKADEEKLQLSRLNAGECKTLNPTDNGTDIFSAAGWFGSNIKHVNISLKCTQSAHKVKDEDVLVWAALAFPQTMYQLK